MLAMWRDTRVRNTSTIEIHDLSCKGHGNGGGRGAGHPEIVRPTWGGVGLFDSGQDPT